MTHHEENEKMIYRDRQMKRYQLLKEIYNTYFETNGKGKQVLIDSTDPQDALAYKYLEDLEFIGCEQIINVEGSANKYTITAKGINFIEEGRGKRRGDFQ